MNLSRFVGLPCFWLLGPCLLSVGLQCAGWLFAPGNCAGQESKNAGLAKLSARASEIDPLAAPHPEIDFVFEKAGRPQDVQHAMVDLRVPSRGKLVIWLMGHNEGLFEVVTSYGYHAIQPHYANKWFSIVCQEKPVGPTCRGDVRLEAATGEDFSDQVVIPKHDGMMMRCTMLVRWLASRHPEGNWQQFLSPEGDDLVWDKVVLAGISHGSTTAARFAKYKRVDRVVMFSGPRDQFQTWQSLPSATPSNRYFGFTHVLDTGWVQSHYCRSWEMIGMHHYGALADVDANQPPYSNSRRLLTAFDVNGDANRAHSSVVPSKGAPRDAQGNFLHEPVWNYLFTHPVDEVGTPVPEDDSCLKIIQQK